MRTRQYNGRRKNAGATNLAQYVQAAMDHSRGAHDAGGKVLHDTPKAKRKEFAREIWWRRGYRNPRDIRLIENPREYTIWKDATGKYYWEIPEDVRQAKGIKNADSWGTAWDRSSAMSAIRKALGAGRNPRGRAEGELEVLDKDPHTEVDYEPRSKHLPEKCGNCAHFIAANPPRCQTVKSPIRSGAWCERYDPRGKNPAPFIGPDGKVWRSGKRGTIPYRDFKIKQSGKLFRVFYPDGREFTQRFSTEDAAYKAVDDVIRRGFPTRLNPSDADTLYRRFHGAKAENHLVFDVPLVDPYGSHPEIAQFGLLVRLVVGESIEVKGSNDSDDFEVKQLADNAWAREISFVPSLGEYKRMVRGLRTQADVDQMKSWLRKQGTPDLAGAPDGQQIYIVGGNQDVSKYLGTLGADESKEYLDLGFAFMVEYFTQKRFDRMAPIDYYHAFGERSFVRPRVVYWRKHGLLQLVGGEYKVTPRGVEN